MGKKNFSINEDKIKVNFMISKEINQKIAYIGILEQCFQNYLNTFCKNIFWVLIITQSVQVL